MFEKSVKLPRRFFLKQAVVFAVGSACVPQITFGRSRTGTLLALADENDAYGWQNNICNLVPKIVSDDQASQEIVRRIRTATIYSAPYSEGFHEAFRSRFLIDTHSSPIGAVRERWFEFDLRPFFDSQNPCRRVKDLNLPEIIRITHAQEIYEYGTIVSPCSPRRPPSNAEYEDYRQTAKRYNVNPDRTTWLYSRNFTNGRKSYVGHAIAIPTAASSNGGLTQQSVPAPASRKDLLLSTDSF